MHQWEVYYKDKVFYILMDRTFAGAFTIKKLTYKGLGVYECDKPPEHDPVKVLEEIVSGAIKPIDKFMRDSFYEPSSKGFDRIGRRAQEIGELIEVSEVSKLDPQLIERCKDEARDCLAKARNVIDIPGEYARETAINLVNAGLDYDQTNIGLQELRLELVD